MQESCEKNCKIIFLQGFIKILQEKLHFSARLVRYIQDLIQDLMQDKCKSCKKNTCKTWIFLARPLLLGYIRVEEPQGGGLQLRSEIFKVNWPRIRLKISHNIATSMAYVINVSGGDFQQGGCL